MKEIFYFIIFINCIAFSIYAQSSKIKVTVLNLENRKGNISIGLFDNPESFPKKTDGKIGKSIRIENDKVIHTFENLVRGKYALAIFHDENMNGEFDRSFMGWPIEDYVFSNYAKGSFGPPSFEDASFDLYDSLEIILEFK